jgi:hypothetical protein
MRCSTTCQIKSQVRLALIQCMEMGLKLEFDRFLSENYQKPTGQTAGKWLIVY